MNKKLTTIAMILFLEAARLAGMIFAMFIFLAGLLLELPFVKYIDSIYPSTFGASFFFGILPVASMVLIMSFALFVFYKYSILELPKLEKSETEVEAHIGVYPPMAIKGDQHGKV